MPVSPAAILWTDEKREWERLVPRLRMVMPHFQPAASAKIESVKWTRLRCRVKVAGQSTGCKVDLRDKAADPTTLLLIDLGLDLSAFEIWAKTVGTDGNVALVVQDDTREGSATTLVLLDAAGNVIDKNLVTVGG